jgi:multiple sugar transport system permease protein
MSRGNLLPNNSSILSGDAPLVVKKRSWGFLLIWPAFLYLLAFLIAYPFLYNVYQSLFDYSMLTGTSKFVGFRNFVDLFTGVNYLSSLAISLFLLISALAMETILGVSIALFLNKNFHGKVLARTLLILPLGTIPVINGYMLNVIFFPGASVIDHILNMAGLVKGPINWLQDPWKARLVIILADVWQWTSFMVILILAGLSAVSESFYELAKLDNLSPWKTFWRITLPKIKFTLTLAMLIRAIDLLKFFDQIFALTKGGPQSATETVSYFIFRFGFKAFKVGYASAGSIIVWAIIWVMSFVVISRVFSKKEVAA